MQLPRLKKWQWQKNKKKKLNNNLALLRTGSKRLGEMLKRLKKSRETLKHRNRKLLMLREERWKISIREMKMQWKRSLSCKWKETELQGLESNVLRVEPEQTRQAKNVLKPFNNKTKSKNKIITKLWNRAIKKNKPKIRLLCKKLDLSKLKRIFRIKIKRLSLSKTLKRYTSKK